MSAQATGAPARTRPGTAKAYLMIGRLTLALIAVQFGLAGLAAFRGLDGGDLEDAWWTPHLILGYSIAGLLVVLALLALLPPVGGLGRVAVWCTALVAVLALIGQPVLSELGAGVSAWFGLLHALNGVVIAGILGVITAHVSRSE